jgi:hypothetical protein
MILGSSTGRILQLVTSAAADIEVAFSAIVIDTANPPVVQGTEFASDPLASITTATTTTILAGAASRTKRIMEMSIRNNHGSTSCDVTVQKTDGTNTSVIIKATLLAGESLVYTEGGVWIHYDTNGAIYPSVGNAATQAEMEAGTATNKYVTPQGVNWHPGACKCWVVAGITGNVLASWNVTSLTDTGTGVMGITIATDFSSVNYCVQVTVEATATTWAVANTRECHVRSATLAVGTVSVDCVDNTATTSLVKDPTTWHVAMFGDQ